MLAKFEGIGKGYRLLILGNAKSLLDIPLDKIHQAEVHTFAMNRIAPIFKSVEWRPFFYLCGTLRARNRKYRNDIYKAIDASKYSFLGARMQYLIDLERIKRSFIYWVDMIDIKDKKVELPKETYWNRCTPVGEISIYGHTGFGAIQLARFMGFDEIILGGMDLPYKVQESTDVDTNHFCADYEVGNLQPKHDQYSVYNRVLNFSHEFTARKAKEDGLKIYSLETNKGLFWYRSMKINELI